MMTERFSVPVAGIILTTALLVQGCAPPFPKEDLDRVNRNISFRELKADPARFKGTWLMLAGIVIAAKNMKEGTTLEVLQKPADSDGRPYDTDRTEGRFLIQSDRFLDSAVYYPGRQIAVIGEVVGEKTLPLDEVQYRYPILDAKALHLWRPETGPRFFFGVGVSSSFH